MSEEKLGVVKSHSTGKFEKASESEVETLNRDHPMSSFLKESREALKNMTEAEFTSAYEAQVKKSNKISTAEDEDTSSSGANIISKINEEIKECDHLRLDAQSVSNNSIWTANRKESCLNGPRTEKLAVIVLKFTTLSEANTEAPSFTITEKGASVGRDTSNEVCVPSDARLALTGHALLENEDGNFFLIDGGQECAASLRIGMGVHMNRRWELRDACRFSAGNTIFQNNGRNKDGHLILEAIDGPLKGEFKIITSEGATIGRSSDNSIPIPDRELSRRHSKIEFDADKEVYYLCDVNSTNGTYMQLVGPYGGRYRLNINDHILIGRTGFSINRYDYGISEEIGHRQTMEDSCAIVQHLNIAALSNTTCRDILYPQSYFAVYDGHGGAEASSFLSRTLHVAVANAVEEIAPALSKLREEEEACGDESSKKVARDSTDRLVIETLKRAFLSTDDVFLKTSEFPHHGSTATTAFILGDRLFCSNTGDSRTMLCRNFSAVPMTTDHKPSREDEAARIRNAGGFVHANRVLGELAVSRAFGDANFKEGIPEEGGSLSESDLQQEGISWDQPLIIAEPEVEVTTIREGDQFLLLACDGLFDVFTYDDIVSFVRANMEEHGDAQRCCQNLTFEAIRKRNSRDNVSVILVILNKWY